MLEVIYVTRHGFRSNWLVDPSTGTYASHIKSPTGIAADPALTAHGVEQAKELAAHLLKVKPPIERVYSSPYYRCLQTVEPFVSLRMEQEEGERVAPSAASDPRRGSSSDGLHSRVNYPDTRIARVSTTDPGLQVRAETGIAEWYGSAPFEHPTSADPATLQALFPALLDQRYRPAIVPSRTGESIAELHDRVAAALAAIVAQCDAEGVRTVLLCTHAAVVIALGRVLTGRMPEDVEVQDFRAFTCGLSVFRRRRSGDVSAFGLGTERGRGTGSGSTLSAEIPLASSSLGAEATSYAEQSKDEEHSVHTRGTRPDPPAWRGGRGVAGGWICELNSDCSFLDGGEERGWRFSGDESFADNKGNVDAGMALGVVVESNNPNNSRL